MPRFPSTSSKRRVASGQRNPSFPPLWLRLARDRTTRASFAQTRKVLKMYSLKCSSTSLVHLQAGFADSKSLPALIFSASAIARESDGKIKWVFDNFDQAASPEFSPSRTLLGAGVTKAYGSLTVVVQFESTLVRSNPPRLIRFKAGSPRLSWVVPSFACIPTLPFWPKLLNCR